MDHIFVLLQQLLVSFSFAQIAWLERDLKGEFKNLTSIGYFNRNPQVVLIADLHGSVGQQLIKQVIGLLEDEELPGLVCKSLVGDLQAEDSALSELSNVQGQPVLAGQHATAKISTLDIHLLIFYKIMILNTIILI